MTDKTEILNKSKAHFYQSVGFKLKKCLCPTMDCDGKAIRAHSVQNSVALSLIEDKNHVYEIKPIPTDSSFTCSFKKIGRNNASTFTGLCSAHDADIFRPIDTNPIDINNFEHLFLIAYRTVTRELHTCMEAAAKLQSAYEFQISLGIASETEYSPAAFEATQHMIKAWSVWKYRFTNLDQDYLSDKFNGIKHSIFLIEGRTPVIAASSFFSVDNKPWGKPFSAAIINVVPLDNSTTAVIVSYSSQQSSAVRKYVSPIFLKQGNARLLNLSHMLIECAENFFVSPSHLESWSQEKIAFIEREFLSTVTGTKKIPVSSELMLF